MELVKKVLWGVRVGVGEIREDSNGVLIGGSNSNFQTPTYLFFARPYLNSMFLCLGIWDLGLRFFFIC